MTSATTRADLHRLVDQLPEHEVHAARRYLEYLQVTSEDAVLKVFLEAPEDDDDLTAAEIAAIEEGKAEAARGDIVSLEAAERRLIGRG